MNRVVLAAAIIGGATLGACASKRTGEHTIDFDEPKPVVFSAAAGTLLDKHLIFSACDYDTGLLSGTALSQNPSGPRTILLMIRARPVSGSEVRLRFLESDSAAEVEFIDRLRQRIVIEAERQQ